MLRIEIVGGSWLRLPTGQLIVADPDPWMHEVSPYQESIPPGDYPVLLSVARFADEPEHTRVAACQLVIARAPTATWTMAIRVGEHEHMLGDGEYFTIGVDSGHIALVDAAVAEAYADIIEDAYDDMTGWVTEVPEPKTGANLLAVSSGWGDGAYPVWTGRAADGTLTCFLVDFLVLRHATPVG